MWTKMYLETYYIKIQLELGVILQFSEFMSDLRLVRHVHSCLKFMLYSNWTTKYSYGFKRKLTKPNLEEQNSTNKGNGTDEKDASNVRNFEAVGMEKLIPSLRRRQNFGKSI